MQFIALIDHHYDYFMSVNRTRHMKSVHIVSGHKLGYFKKRGDAIISQILECALKGGGHWQGSMSMPLYAHLTRLEHVQVTYLIVKRDGLAFFLCGGDRIPES